jgi:hypothetical protein
MYQEILAGPWPPSLEVLCELEKVDPGSPIVKMGKKSHLLINAVHSALSVLEEIPSEERFFKMLDCMRALSKVQEHNSPLYRELYSLSEQHVLNLRVAWGLK